MWTMNYILSKMWTRMKFDDCRIRILIADYTNGRMCARFPRVVAQAPNPRAEMLSSAALVSTTSMLTIFRRSRLDDLSSRRPLFRR